jgi:hypothetical protein
MRLVHSVSRTEVKVDDLLTSVNASHVYANGLEYRVLCMLAPTPEYPSGKIHVVAKDGQSFAFAASHFDCHWEN